MSKANDSKMKTNSNIEIRAGASLPLFNAHVPLITQAFPRHDLINVCNPLLEKFDHFLFKVYLHLNILSFLSFVSLHIYIRFSLFGPEFSCGFFKRLQNGNVFPVFLFSFSFKTRNHGLKILPKQYLAFHGL